MLNRRTFRAVVGGREYYIPTSMAVLREAETASGSSLIEAVAENKLAGMLQGVLYAGLLQIGVKEIDGDKLTYDLIGEVCDFAETQENYVGFMQAMMPETAEADEQKNEPAEEQEKNSPGESSSDTDTESVI